MPVSLGDEIRIQSLREQGYRTKVIVDAYTHRTAQCGETICQCVDGKVSATERKVDSGP